jgi:serine/threonine protein kinase
VLTRQRFLQVIDLGSAEFVLQGEEVPHAFGTVRYSSPEMAAHSAGPASDVWSVGIVLCQVLTGRVPFLKDNDLETLAYIKKGPEVSRNSKVLDVALAVRSALQCDQTNKLG